MTAHTHLHSIKDLGGAEPHIIDAINRETRGSELFLVDPLRFLREHGFHVGAALESDLRRLLPLGKLPAHLYDGIRAGKASVVSGASPTKSVRTMRIERLGIPPEELK
jgi:hypothetical protein